MISQIIAILVLHDMGIVHHDVKPTNILVDSDGHCVLTDYGGSHFLSEVARTSIPTPPATLQVNADDVGEDLVHQQRRQSKHAPILTLRYAAPEVLDGRDGQNIGRAADFWSLGITLFELASGQVINRNISPCVYSSYNNICLVVVRILLTMLTMKRLLGKFKPAKLN